MFTRPPPIIFFLAFPFSPIFLFLDSILIGKLNFNNQKHVQLIEIMKLIVFKNNLWKY